MGIWEIFTEHVLDSIADLKKETHTYTHTHTHTHPHTENDKGHGDRLGRNEQIGRESKKEMRKVKGGLILFPDTVDTDRLHLTLLPNLVNFHIANCTVYRSFGKCRVPE